MNGEIYLFFFCLLMDSHCVPGFGNTAHVPLVAKMHAESETETGRRAVCRIPRERESCHVQSEGGLGVGAVRCNETTLLILTLSSSWL